MILGTYTFDRLPKKMTMIKPDKINSAVQTYTSVAYFSWTPSIVGKRISLNWNAMTTAQFDSLDAIFQTDEEVVFDPTDYTGGSAFKVEVTNFNGDYLAEIGENRLNCVLKLLIMSVV
jgi:hypothetical protein